jgi:hypothetical protein
VYKKLSLLLALVLLSHSTALAIGSKKAAYVGGTAPAFKDAKKVVEGELITNDEKELKFVYNKTQTFAIPYDQIIDLEYGKKSGRRVGTAVATTVLLGPIGLLSLMSKKQKHYLTIGYKDEAGKDQVALFELGKDIFRTTLAIVETRSGKKIEYQDKKDEKKAEKEKAEKEK